jgi:hypothetical protein
MPFRQRQATAYPAAFWPHAIQAPPALQDLYFLIREKERLKKELLQSSPSER